MIRHLIPHFDAGHWGGAALTDDGSPTGDDARGFCICGQWLGVIIELGIGRVRTLPQPASTRR